MDSIPVLSLFFKNHFNDFLYMPITLTICLAVIRWSKRLPKFKLTIGMIVSMTLFCSITFEYIAPSYYTHTTGDWWDVLMYGLGGAFYYVSQTKYVTKIVF